jgi:4-carboxymuconolactone decarboxylase
MDDLAKGLSLRKAVVGEDYVAKALASATDFDRPFQDLITQYGWGAVWSRPGLSLRDRSLVTLATIAALSRPDELAIHIRAALTNGCTPEEIRETFLHTTLYAGVAAGADATYLAKDIIAQHAEEGETS